MKKVLALILALVMVLSFVACGEKKEEAKKEEQKQEQQQEQKQEENKEETTDELPEIKDITEKVTFTAFSFKVNGVEVNNDTLKDLHIYKIKVTSTNSKGVESENSYGGYKLADVLKACGIENATSVKVIASDGYESTLGAEYINSDWTLVAIEKDKAQSEDGTIWIAPCESTVGNVYCKLVVELKAE